MSEVLPGPGSNIALRTLPNLRDLGGYATGDGRVVRRGQLYRSVLLGRLSDEDVARVRELDLQVIFDFRTAAEHRATPVTRTRGKAEPAALTVRLTRRQWERLHQLALAEGVSLQRLIVDGLGTLFRQRGLPEL